jgi:Holliday junction resolvase RusA-like endonuclease
MVSDGGYPVTGALSLFFTVPSTPMSKGSRTQVAPGRNIEAGTTRSRKRKKAQAWSITGHALYAMTGSPLPRRTFPLAKPVRVDVCFFFPIAKSRLRGKRRIEPGALHDIKPDRDKCLRQLGDALTTAGVFTDDCRDALGWSEKRWCLPGEERTEVRISWD